MPSPDSASSVSCPGTALDPLFVRRLVDGDQGGYMRRGLEAFPFPDMARRIWQEYFVPGGKPSEAPYPAIPMHQRKDTRKLVELCIVSNFVEVFLAREGHKNPVGINFLEKVQMPHLPSIYGAMLAGVGYVLMGAGIPLHIPGVLDAFAAHHAAEYKLSVAGALPGQDTQMQFDPADYVEGPLPLLHRPQFLAIVSQHAGHNHAAPGQWPRQRIGNRDPDGRRPQCAAPGKLQLNAAGEPVYGERDRVNLEELRALGVPFWLAGGYGNAEKLREALEQGAAGIQVGTAFAFSQESGMRPDLKKKLMAQAKTGSGVVFTDPLASPTGFPFKVALLEGTSSELPIYQERKRVCDLGYLREPYSEQDGRIGYRCAAEPVDNYIAKGGKVEDTVGRKCLCNALLANIGHAQSRKDDVVEPALVTVGDDLNTIAQFLAPGRDTYSAADVVNTLLSGVASETADEAEPLVLATA